MVHYSRRFAWGAILVCLLTGIIACRYQPVWDLTPTPAPPSTETPTPGPTKTPTSIIPTPMIPQGNTCISLVDALQGRWTDVRNTRYGYQFEIPVSWSIDDSLGANYWEISSDSGGGTNQSSCDQLQIYVAIEGVEQWVGWNPEVGYQETSVDGHDAWRLDSGSSDDQNNQRTSQILFQAGGSFYVIRFVYQPASQTTSPAATPVTDLFPQAVDTWLETFKVYGTE